MQVLAWQRRAQALAPAGVVASGAVARRLVAQLRARSGELIAGLAAVATCDMLVLMGANADLPWIDGARYCAPDPLAQTLWLPTHMMPVLPADLVRRSLAGRTGTRPLLLWNEPEYLLPLDQTRELTPELLDWLAGALQ